MKGLFDDPEPLFKEEKISNSVQTLFDPREANTPSSVSCLALPPDDCSAPPVVTCSPSVEPAILLPDVPLVSPPPQQLSTVQQAPVFHQEPLGSPIQPPSGPVVPAAAFGEPEVDPLIAQALRHAAEKYPDQFAAHKGFFVSQFTDLLPLSFDKITVFGEKALSNVQMVLQEVSVSSQTISALSVPSTIQGVIHEARDAVQGGAAHGLGGLLKRVEHAVVRPFDPQAAQNTLMRLFGGVKSIHGRLSGITDLAQETLTSIQLSVVVISVVSGMAEKTDFAQHTQRRHDLLLTTGQELQLALKQLDQLRSQTEQALMQIEETRTVTLPSLGFLGAI